MSSNNNKGTYYIPLFLSPAREKGLFLEKNRRAEGGKRSVRFYLVFAFLEVDDYACAYCKISARSSRTLLSNINVTTRLFPTKET
jgi:hypothetical protein